MPKGTELARLEAIKAFGAEAYITDVNYDDTVRMARKIAAECGGIMVQDTSWEGYEDVPMHIMQGYTTMGYEIVQQLQGLDTLLLEANHDIHMLETGVYTYPLKRRIKGNRGLLSNERSGQLLCELLHDKFGTVVLGHLSKENNYEELAYEAVRLEVTMGDNPYKADDFPMYVAKRNAVSPVIRAE